MAVIRGRVWKYGDSVNTDVIFPGKYTYTVNELAEALDKSQPLMSWHLRRLKAAGIVKIRRSGREVYCSLDREALQQQQEKFQEFIGLA